MYYIVEFIESREVEVVPALWVNNDVCQWPDHHRSTELKKSIKNKEQPGPSWDAFSVRILYTAENYQTARLKLPQAENHTDLQTAEEDEDDIPKRKRKRLSNIRFESDSDSDNDAFHKKTNSVFNNLPPPPKINGPGFEVQAAVNNQALTRKPHNHRRPTSLGYTSTPVSRQSSTTPNVSSPIARGSMSSPEPRHLEHNRLSSANEFVHHCFKCHWRSGHKGQRLENNEAMSHQCPCQAAELERSQWKDCVSTTGAERRNFSNCQKQHPNQGSH
uniref:Uncharacterized protein n=1 Tax=Oryzias melastigma TaxID=30732 RepID=A0A3B3DUL9_ORYME